MQLTEKANLFKAVVKRFIIMFVISVWALKRL